MKIRYIVGDLTSIPNGILVNGCNATGNMGKGAALQIFKKWPKVYEQYVQGLHDGSLALGGIQYTNVRKNLNVVNAIFHKGDSVHAVNHDALYSCFVKLFTKDKTFSVSIPKIGAGVSADHFAVVLDDITYAAKNTNWKGFLDIYSLDYDYF